MATLMQTMRTAAERLLAWVEADHENWHEMEAEVRSLGQDLCTQMLIGVATALAPRYPTTTIACGCGGQAEYQRRRAAQVQTVFGVVRGKHQYRVARTDHVARREPFVWGNRHLDTTLAVD